jgi:protein-S-isoprenylcysteine O-methyltransferase Ste14
VWPDPRSSLLLPERIGVEMAETSLREKNGEHPAGDAGQVILFCVFLIVWVADSLFLRWTTFPAASVSLVLRLVVAAAVLAVAVWLVRASHFIVSGDERPSEVVRSGPFRYVRHPLYLSAVLLYVGLTIATLSLLSVAVLVVILLFYDFIAGYEERLLLAKFGEPYQCYRRATGKWLPKRVGARASPGDGE